MYMKTYNPEKEMRKNIFESSHFYLGYSSKKRNELKESLDIPEETDDYYSMSQFGVKLMFY